MATASEVMVHYSDYIHPAPLDPTSPSPSFMSLGNQILLCTVKDFHFPCLSSQSFRHFLVRTGGNPNISTLKHFFILL